jgi:hypothetical protein
MLPASAKRDRSKRVVLQQSTQVLRRGFEVLLGQPDHERLGQLEEAAALAAVDASHLGARRHRFHRGVDLDIQGPAGALGRELLVLAQRGADRGRIVAAPEERPAVDQRGPGSSGPSLVCRASVIPGVHRGVWATSRMTAKTSSTGRPMVVTIVNSFMAASSDQPARP